MDKVIIFYSGVDAYETGYGWNVIIPYTPTLLVASEEEANAIALECDLIKEE